MATAMLCSKNEQTVRASAADVGVAFQYVSRASIVLQSADVLAPAVMAGTLSLNDAHAEAQERKTARETREEREERAERDLAALRLGLGRPVLVGSLDDLNDRIVQIA